MPVLIRPYHEDDICACRSLWADLVQQHRDIYDDQSIGGPDPGEHFDEYLHNPALVQVWVGDDRGKVVGLAGLLVQDGEGEIEPVVVARGYRRQGVGQMLVEQAVAEARTRDLRYLNVRPVARNLDAIRFFIEHGFATAGRVELFMDLRGYPARKWKTGLNLHGHDVKY